VRSSAIGMLESSVYPERTSSPDRSAFIRKATAARRGSRFIREPALSRCRRQGRETNARDSSRILEPTFGSS
jgi:hypothetical protein